MERNPAETPFTEEVALEVPPKDFRLPHLKSYDGTSDPNDHVASFTATMQLSGAPDAIMCKALPATFEKGARTWFNTLPPGSIGSYCQLTDLLIRRFAMSKRTRKTPSDLIAIVQGHNEPLRDYVERYNKATVEIPNLTDQTAMAGLINGLNDRTTLRHDLTIKPFAEYHSLVDLANKYARAEEDTNQRSASGYKRARADEYGRGTSS